MHFGSLQKLLINKQKTCRLAPCQFIKCCLQLYLPFLEQIIKQCPSSQEVQKVLQPQPFLCISQGEEKAAAGQTGKDGGGGERKCGLL